MDLHPLPHVWHPLAAGQPHVREAIAWLRCLQGVQQKKPPRKRLRLFFMGEFLVSGNGMVTLGMGEVLETCIAKTRRCVCRYVRGCQHLSKHHVSSGMVVLLADGSRLAECPIRKPHEATIHRIDDVDRVKLDKTINATIQYNTIQYNTIQYNTIQYNTIQYIINTVRLFASVTSGNLLTIPTHLTAFSRIDFTICSCDIFFCLWTYILHVFRPWSQFQCVFSRRGK